MTNIADPIQVRINTTIVAADAAVVEAFLNRNTARRYSVEAVRAWAADATPSSPDLVVTPDINLPDGWVDSAWVQDMEVYETISAVIYGLRHALRREISLVHPQGGGHWHPDRAVERARSTRTLDFIVGRSLPR